MGNLIDRERLIELINELEYPSSLTDVKRVIMSMPYTERQKGEWIDINGDGTSFKCSICNSIMCCNDNYCPNCGADMRGNGTDDKRRDTESI